MAGARIQLKRATASQWTSANTVLFAGEIGYETDTNKFKIGDGTTAWTSLSYFNGNLSGSNLNDLLDVTITSAANGDFLRWNGTAWINDAVNLSTDTVGSYVESLVAGTGVTVTNNSGEGAAPTIAIGQSVATSASPTFVDMNLTGNVVFEGSTANAFETTLAVTDPTADQTITLPNVTGTVITTGDTGTVTSTMIADGTIVNADVNASAAIAHSKLADTTAGQVLLGTTTTGVVTATTLTGDVTISGAGVTAIGSGKVTSSMIVDGTIVNGDIDASAGIALSKLASGTSAQVIVADASGVPTYTTLTGDVTISNTGVTSIAANSVSLGTDTTGNYVNDVTAGTGVTITHTPGEGSSATVAIGQSVATGDSPTFANVTISSAPTGVNHAATKAYVDFHAAGIVWHDAVKLGTAAVLPGTPGYSNGTSGVGATLTAASNARLIVDGTNATTNDRVLVKDQAAATQNGVYTVTNQGSVSAPYVLTRATDFDASPSYENIGASGDAAYITAGSSNANQGFITLSTGTGANGTYVIGTDDITFGQFTGTATFTAGAGLATTGNIVNVQTVNSSRIVVNSDDIDLATVTRTNTSGSAGKSFIQSFATDAYGRVTGAVTADTAITLGTDTSGSYVESLVAGTGITLSNNSGEGATPTVAVTANTYDAYGAASTAAGNAATALTNHENDTTNIHGIADTSILVTTTGTQTLTNKTITSPAGMVKGDVGLGNVDNTADTAKPVSTAQQTALDLKAPLASPTFTGTVTVPTPVSNTDASTKAYADSTASTTASNAATALTNHEADTTSIHGIADTSILVTTTGTQTLTNKTITSPSGLVKGDVGLGSVDNTADTAKPVSTAQQTALDLKANLASPTFTGTPTLPTGTIATTQTASNNTTAVATTAYVDTADALKADLASPTFTGTVSAVNLTLSGDLTVNGTTTTINSTTITVDDKNIELGSVATPTDVTADGGGITLKGTTDKTLNWVDATDAWTSSEHLNLASGKAFYISGTSVLNATTLGSAVTGSSLTSLGTIATGVWQGTLIGATYGGTGVNNGSNTITLAGNVSHAGAFTQTFTATATTSVTLPTTGTLATLDGTETLTNKTLTSPTADTPTLTLSTSTSTTAGRIAYDSTALKLIVGDGTTAREYASSTVIANAQTASYTAVLGDKDKLVEMSNASANTLTIPPNSSVAFPVGTQIRVLQTNTGQCTLTAGAGVTINATPGLKLRTQWASATLIKRATDTWVAVGDLSA